MHDVGLGADVGRGVVAREELLPGRDRERLLAQERVARGRGRGRGGGRRCGRGVEVVEDAPCEGGWLFEGLIAEAWCVACRVGREKRRWNEENLHRKGAIAPSTRPFSIHSGSPGCSRRTRSTSAGFEPLCAAVSSSASQPPEQLREARTAGVDTFGCEKRRDCMVTHQPGNRPRSPPTDSRPSDRRAR